MYAKLYSSLKILLNTNLLFVSHGATTQNSHFCHGILLEPFHRIAFGAEKLSNKVELKVDSKHYGTIKDATLTMAKSCMTF